jgi:predicted DNA-binding transcriptional regulator YafY
MNKLLLAEIEAAITEKRSVTFKYTAYHGNAKDVTARTIQPHKMWPGPGQRHGQNTEYYYVTGWCRLRRDIRTFRTDRMELARGGETCR